MSIKENISTMDNYYLKYILKNYPSTPQNSKLGHLIIITENNVNFEKDTRAVAMIQYQVLRTVKD